MGYLFLGSNDKNFNEKFTRNSFKMKPKEDMTHIELLLLEEFERSQQDSSYRLQAIDGKCFNHEVSVKLLHCAVCDKIHIDMSDMYCVGCAYYTTPQERKQGKENK